MVSYNSQREGGKTMTVSIEVSAPEYAVRQFGKEAALAAFCGVSQQRVSQWVRAGRIPEKHIRAIADHLGIPEEHLQCR
jgi:DNA-binding transcriptional regulator YdaS (Cro superfamily)